MTKRSVTHSTFGLEREYAVPPARVFAAWSDPEAKAEWFGASDFELDFRIGGREVNRGGPEGGPVFTYDARYQDIVDGERIVYTYDMLMDDARISVSVTTVEFEPSGDGTRLTYTEQCAFLDGHDTPEQREQGTGTLFEKLAEVLEREPANT
jgi:uncharacterized protein YndB with AHSA1/START domain